jgi:hypothetical protein
MLYVGAGWPTLAAQAPNQALEPTPESLRCAAAFGRGSPLALGFRKLTHVTGTQLMSEVLGRLTIKRKTGQEPFHTAGQALGFDLMSFWQ